MSSVSGHVELPTKNPGPLLISYTSRKPEEFPDGLPDRRQSGLSDDRLGLDEIYGTSTTPVFSRPVECRRGLPDTMESVRGLLRSRTFEDFFPFVFGLVNIIGC